MQITRQKASWKLAWHGLILMVLTLLLLAWLSIPFWLERVPGFDGAAVDAVYARPATLPATLPATAPALPAPALPAAERAPSPPDASAPGLRAPQPPTLANSQASSPKAGPTDSSGKAAADALAHTLALIAWEREKQAHAQQQKRELEWQSKSRARDLLLTAALLPLGALLAWLALRHLATMMLWARVRAQMPADVRPNVDAHLLPSQSDLVDRLVQSLDRSDQRALTGKWYAIEGAWGSGKSTVLRGLESRLRREPNTAVTYISAWRDEALDDQHFRLVERLLMTPEVLAGIDCGGPGAMWGPPLTLRCLWRMQRRRALQNGRPPSRLFKLFFEVPTLPVRGEMTLGAATPLDYQEDLERIAARLQAHGVRLAIFLDEIERATPAAAQTTLVMFRRALDLPGVHVVLAYVPEVLRFNAFHPLNMVSAELRSSAYAVISQEPALFDAAMQAAAAPAPRARSGRGRPAGAGVYGAAQGSAGDGPSPPGQFAPNVDGDAVDAPTLRRRQAAQEALLSGYLPLDSSRREVMHRRIAEKYLGARWELHAINAQDLVEFTWRRIFVDAQGALKPNVLTQMLIALIAPALQPLEAERSDEGEGDGDLISAPVLLAATADKLQDATFRDAVGELLQFLLKDDRHQRFDLLTPGRMSLRRLESKIEQVIQGGSSALTPIRWPRAPLKSHDTERGRLAWAMAQLIFVAVGLLHLEEGHLFKGAQP